MRSYLVAGVVAYLGLVFIMSFQNCQKMGFQKPAEDQISDDVITTSGDTTLLFEVNSTSNREICAQHNQIIIQLKEGLSSQFSCQDASVLEDGVQVGSQCDEGCAIVSAFISNTSKQTCRNLSLCGQLPLEVVNTGENTYRLIYNDLPWGCKIKVRVLASNNGEEKEIGVLEDQVNVPPSRFCEATNKYTCGTCSSDPVGQWSIEQASDCDCATNTITRLLFCRDGETKEQINSYYCKDEKPSRQISCESSVCKDMKKCDKYSHGDGWSVDQVSCETDDEGHVQALLCTKTYLCMNGSALVENEICQTTSSDKCSTGDTGNNDCTGHTEGSTWIEEIAETQQRECAAGSSGSLTDSRTKYVTVKCVNGKKSEIEVKFGDWNETASSCKLNCGEHLHGSTWNTGGDELQQKECSPGFNGIKDQKRTCSYVNKCEDGVIKTDSECTAWTTVASSCIKLEDRLFTFAQWQFSMCLECWSGKFLVDLVPYCQRIWYKDEIVSTVGAPAFSPQLQVNLDVFMNEKANEICGQCSVKNKSVQYIPLVVGDCAIASPAQEFVNVNTTCECRE